MEPIIKNWQESFIKGTLSYWILLALEERPRTMQEIRDYIALSTDGQISVDDNSLYRTLRRLYDIDIVDFETIKNSSGPDRKLYELSTNGHNLLGEFTRRMIAPIVAQPYVKASITTKEKKS